MAQEPDGSAGRSGLRRVTGRVVRAPFVLSRRRAEIEALRRKNGRQAAQLGLSRQVIAETSARLEQLSAELARRDVLASVAEREERTDLEYLFIVTYGRSGSTLLQGLLSTIPNVLVRGENGGALLGLFHYHQTARRHRDRLSQGGILPPTHPWWGIDGYDDATALRAMRTLVLQTLLRPHKDTRVVGFKEIDWPDEELPEFIGFITDLFPGARYVLNTRNLDEVAVSKWWANRPDAPAQLADLEKRLVEALEVTGADFYRVHYNDYVADPAVLSGLFEWLGQEFDERSLRQVMDVPHSY